MGLNVASIKYLMLMKEKFSINFNRFAMLGRQELIISDSDLDRLCSVIGFTDNIETLKGKDGFSENILARLFRCDKIDSIDYSDYEGATVCLDLNEPISPEHDECYDLVLDGGTLEHIFNYPVALQNAMRMCSVGGYLILMTPSNNYNGHGFYQFSPDLFKDVLGNNGFEIKDISYIEEYGEAVYVSYRVGGIDEKRINKRKASLYVCAQKKENTPIKLSAQQSKWFVWWMKGKERREWQKSLEFYDLDRELNYMRGQKDREIDNRFSGCTILLYGAGKVCRKFLEKADLQGVKIVGIADRNAKFIQIDGYTVKTLDYFKDYPIDYIVISTGEDLAEEIKAEIAAGNLYGKEQVIGIEEFIYYQKPCIY